MSTSKSKVSRVEFKKLRFTYINKNLDMPTKKNAKYTWMCILNYIFEIFIYLFIKTYLYRVAHSE